MQALPTLKINEIFHSFQGEGNRAGVASIFVRLAGCLVKCPYCDTKEAWHTGSEQSLETVLAAIAAQRKVFPQAQVVFTGGEPLEQDLALVANTLKQQGCFLAIETHGGLFQDLPLDWWTVAPKDVTDYYIHPRLLPLIKEIKLVVNAHLTPQRVAQLRQLVPGVPFYLQPEAHHNNRYIDTFRLFQQCQELGLTDIRCGIQLHRIYHVQ